MKKNVNVILIFILLVSILKVDSNSIDKVYITDSFFKKIIEACSLLDEAREFEKEDKTIKAQNKSQEAIEMLNKAISTSNIININKDYNLKVSGKKFEIIFDTKEIYSIVFDFDHEIRETYDNFKSKKYLTNRVIAEKIQEAQDGDIVEAKLKFVPAVEYSVSKYFRINTDYEDRGVSILIAVQVLDFNIIN